MSAVPCEGRPGLACPERRCDKTVHLSQGDLMLCMACERFRFPEIGVQRPPAPKKEAVTVRNETNKTQQKATEERRSNEYDTSSMNLHSDSHSGASATSSINDNKPTNAVYNELLSYVNFFRDKSTAEMLRKVVLGFYLPAEIAQAKKILIESSHASLKECPLKADRRSSSTRKAHDAELDDIIGIFDYMDGQALLNRMAFHSTALDRLPGLYGPEEINIAVIADRQIKIDARVALLTSSVADLSADNNVFTSQSIGEVIQSVENLNARFIELSVGIQGQLKSMSESCQQLASSVRRPPNSAVVVPIATADGVDRSKNVVIFGIEENRENRLWMEVVNKVLRITTNKDVEVTDAFRLGRRLNEGINRPVLVKLNTAWDRRLVLIGASKLAQCDELKRIYVSPDESLEVRRKTTLERLKKKAARDGKTFTVSNEVLSVNNEAVFSLRDGFIRKTTFEIRNRVTPSSPHGVVQ